MLQNNKKNNILILKHCHKKPILEQLDSYM